MKPPVASKEAAQQRRILWAIAQRLGLLLAIGVSLLTAWWSVNRLIEAQRQTAALDQQVARLNSDIERMHATWSATRIAEVDARFSQAQENLFDGAEALNAWQNDILEASIPLALDTVIQFKETRPASIGAQDLTVMSADVDLAPAPGVASDRTSYRRILHLAQRLTSQPRRLDLVELAVQGGSNSVRHASARLELWAVDQETPQP